MLPQAYLTDRQLEIWRLRFKGFSKAEVGRRLGITRQAVYDAEKYTLGKVESALRHVAEASRIEVQFLDPSRGGPPRAGSLDQRQGHRHLLSEERGSDLAP